ncbi:hypothetical protein FB451DRAFT_1170416 [Mycena latifolia]|nr:hypothetical protein FB451DRAFT_1170416 [Mycena latifolia]
MVDTGRDSAQGDLFAIDNFFDDVLQRAPRIRNLDFRSRISFHALGPALTRFILGLPELRTVLLSDTLLASDVIAVLAKCPHLEAIRLPPPHELAEIAEARPPRVAQVRRTAPLAERCPRMPDLALNVHLDAAVPPGPPPLFRPLAHLRFGLSGCEYDEQQVVLFVVNATPAACRVQTEVIYLRDVAQNDALCDHVELREAGFVEVLVLLPMVRRVHAQYEARRRSRSILITVWLLRQDVKN